jgi:stage II sporulation protein P
MLLDDIKEKEPTLRYFIDLHRDSVNKNISTININGEDYAKLLFIVGLENPNYSTNLKFTEELNNKLDKMYPGLSRGIYKKKGPGVNGVYNQDFDPNTILIEVGGEENTIDEIYNSCMVISDILTSYIKGDNNES